MLRLCKYRRAKSMMWSLLVILLKSTLWYSIDTVGQVMYTSPSSEILSGRIVWLLSETGLGVIALPLQGSNGLSSRRASWRRKVLATSGRISKCKSNVLKVSISTNLYFSSEGKRREGKGGKQQGKERFVLFFFFKSLHQF